MSLWSEWGWLVRVITIGIQGKFYVRENLYVWTKKFSNRVLSQNRVWYYNGSVSTQSSSVISTQQILPDTCSKVLNLFLHEINWFLVNFNCIKTTPPEIGELI